MVNACIILLVWVPFAHLLLIGRRNLTERGLATNAEDAVRVRRRHGRKAYSQRGLKAKERITQNYNADLDLLFKAC